MIFQVNLYGQEIITVGPTVSYDYQTIQPAIEDAISRSGHVTIKIADMAMTCENQIVVNFATTDTTLLGITIESIEQNPATCTFINDSINHNFVHIIGRAAAAPPYPSLSIRNIGFMGVNPSPSSITPTSPIIVTNPVDTIKIEGCTFDAFRGAIFFTTNYCLIGEITIRDNIFSFPDNVTILGSGAITILNPCAEVNICNNAFNGFYSEPINISSSSFIFMSGNNFDLTFPTNLPNNQLFSTININGAHYNENSCSIIDNTFNNAYFEIVNTTGTIESNKFFIDPNIPFWVMNQFIEIYSTANAVDLEPLKVNKNMFLGNTDFAAIFLRYQDGIAYPRRQVSLNGNSFINCRRVLYIESYQNSNISPVVSFMSNLIKSTLDPVVTYSMSLTPWVITPPILLQYSCFDGVAPNNASVSIEAETCHIGDALITLDNPNLTYTLIWDTNQKSPLINTGYPGANNELTDPDGTPPDIGCVYYPHEAKRYDFERSISLGIYWMSFPVIDDRSYEIVNNVTVHWNELGHLFIEHMLPPPDNQLSQIEWNYGGNPGIMKYFGSEWQNTDYIASQQKGFKVKFNEVQPSAVDVYGFKVNAATTSVDIVAQDEYRPVENWIGYFVPYSQKAGDAFSRLIPGKSTTYLDHIYSIKTQKWGVTRVAYEYESAWCMDPNTYTFSEGDMAAILLLHDAPETLYWSMLGESDPVERSETQYFTYTEKMDYTPVFIEFDPNDIPSEVGVFVNGECLGASVVEGNVVDVCFYLEESKNSDDIEIFFFYHGKGKSKAPNYTVYNPQRQVFEKTKLYTSNIGDHIYISYKKGDGESIKPLTTSLQANYPNPFNPQTTISFTLSKNMPVRIDIFNVKGQKVKTLVNEILGLGRHQHIWNGRDDNNRIVASGVYFARLSTPDGSQIQKMMLLK